MFLRVEKHGRQTKKKGKEIYVFLIAIGVLLFLIGVSSFFIYSVIHSYYDNDTVDIVDVNAEIQKQADKTFNIELEEVDLTAIQGGTANKDIYKVVPKDKDILNVVLVGVDARQGEEVSRSDSVILLSYNRRTHTVKLVSFLRDNWVHIPDYGWGKLNSATVYGGVGLLVNTLNENFDLDIQHYVQIDFEGFAKVIDILDGIDVELTKQEINYINNKLHKEDRDYNNDIEQEPGVVHLNGVQALWHCRNRSIGNSDFSRTERQRDVLEIILAKGMKMNITQVTKMVYAMKDYVDMNVPLDVIIGLARDALVEGTLEVESYKIPFDEYFEFATKAGQSVIVLNMEKTTYALLDTLGYFPSTESEGLSSASPRPNGSVPTAKLTTTVKPSATTKPTTTANPVVKSTPKPTIRPTTKPSGYSTDRIQSGGLTKPSNSSNSVNVDKAEPKGGLTVPTH